MNKELNVLIIPGGGEYLSEQRVMAAHEDKLFRWADVCIFSGGGIVKSSVIVSDIREAVYMSNVFKKLHYSQCKVLIEDTSLDTFENIRLSILLLLEHVKQTNYKKITLLIASDHMHLERFRLSIMPILSRIIAGQEGSGGALIVPKFYGLNIVRSLKERLMEHLIFLPIHWISPTGDTFPVSLITGWNRRRRTNSPVSG